MSLIDSLIIIIYLAGIVSVGVACRGKQDNINDYFTARDGFGGAIGTVMVGLSLGATLFSALSFVVFPSVVYTYGVTALSGILCFPIAYLFLRYWFIPRYFSQQWNSPYDVIEHRFGRGTRLVASGMFVVLRLCWMSALIYAPVVVVMASCGLDREWFWPLILSIGLVSTAYTVVGGIRGVIITDAIQFLLIILVLLGTITYVLVKIPLSMGEISDYLNNNTGLLTINWSLDPTLTMTLWAMVIGSTMQNMSSFTADQMSLQRYLASGSAQSATRAFGMSMISTTIVLLLLAAVGLTLGAWYNYHPDTGLPNDPERVFPYFVATRLPIGFMGIVIAAILAATMSSITSGINALSGSLMNDFAPLAERIGSKRLLNYARASSAGIGVLATIVAGYVEKMGSLFDIVNIFYGIFLGPLLGCMICTLGRFYIKSSMMIMAMGVGCGAGLWVAYSPLSSLWVSAFSSIVTVATAWLGSRLLKNNSNSGSTRGIL